MNYSEMIADFLDGALSANEELKLFAAMAQDNDLRAEFKELLTIHTAVKQDSSAFAIPPASENALFSRLGFASASEAAPALVSRAALPEASSVLASGAQSVVRSGTSYGGMRFFAVLGAVFSAALLSALFTAWLFRSGFGENNSYALNARNGGDYGNGGVYGNRIYRDGAYRNGALPQPVVITDTVVRRVVVEERRLLIPSASARGDFSNYALFNPYQVYSSAQSLENQAGHENSNAINVRPENNSVEKQLQVAPPHDAALHSTTPYTAQPIASASPQESLQPAIMPPAKPIWGVEFTARGVVGRSLIGATLAPKPEQFPTNAIIGASYRLSPHHSIGLEAGQESFFQRFYTRDANDIDYRTEQHPTLAWAGVAWRYTMLPETALSPFLHFVLGVTEVSAVGRGMAGMSYTPDARTTIFLGAELASLLYQYENSPYLSPKFNVSYGVSVRF